MVTEAFTNTSISTLAESGCRESPRPDSKLVHVTHRFLLLCTPLLFCTRSFLDVPQQFVLLCTLLPWLCTHPLHTPSRSLVDVIRQLKCVCTPLLVRTPALVDVCEVIVLHRQSSCRSQFPHKFFDLYFIITNIKKKLTDLCWN